MLSKPKIQSKHKGDPRSVKEAMRSPDSVQWMKAKEAEDQSLEENGTWIRVDEKEIPSGTKVIHGKYIFDVRRHADGTIKKHKVRLLNIS